jgi:hypothetical protein
MVAILDPIVLTVDAEVYNLAKINPGNYSGEYYDVSAAGTERATLNIKHTLPTGNGAIESHLFRLDIENLDADGLVERSDGVWVVWKTSGAAQDATRLLDMLTGMVTALQASTDLLTTQILGRQS